MGGLSQVAAIRPEFLFDGPARASHVFLFAHGAGAPMDHAFMNTIARGIAAQGIRVARFEFPYMAARRNGGRRGAPDRPSVLLDTYRSAIEAVRRPSTVVVIGGKSMGGRMASMVADEMQVAGLVCFGYPFHPAGRPLSLRTEHLASLRTPTLILQGERDALGSRDDVANYNLSKAIRVQWLPDGDHSLKPRKASGRTERENLEAAIAASVDFVRARERFVAG
jgi:predicted alpha/beta-hydrolase family hydrolase